MRRIGVSAIACVIALSACNGDGSDEGAAGSGAVGVNMPAGTDGSAGTGGSAGTDGIAGTGGSAGTGGVDAGAFVLQSSAAEDGGMLPAKHRCMVDLRTASGPSPALSWSGAPAGTQSFAILMRDRNYMDYEHWSIYDIPASVTALPEGVALGAAIADPAGAKQAENAALLMGPGFYGPCARGTNMYEFTLYALDVATLPDPGTTGDSVQAAVEAHDLAAVVFTVFSGPPM